MKSVIRHLPTLMAACTFALLLGAEGKVAADDYSSEPASLGAQSFSEWTAANGLSGSEASPAASPAGDGVSNLLKFALDLDPNISVRAGDLPIGQINQEGRMTLTYLERFNVDVTYKVERSTDLLIWQKAETIETDRVSLAGGDRVTVREILPAAADRVFLRLRVDYETFRETLSSDPLTPTRLEFVLGENVVSGQVDTPRNQADFFTFTVPDGAQLSTVYLLEWIAEDDNVGFAHIDSGSSTVVPTWETIDDFLGGAHINEALFGPSANLLAGLADAAQGGTGFTLPLPAGDYTFNVQQTGPEPSNYTLLFIIEEIPAPVEFNVVSSGFSAYLIDGQSNATLNLVREQTYVFNISASGHPFLIKTTATTGTGNTYSIGVTNNGIANGVLTFTVPAAAPATLYYICQFHSTMRGVINIVDAPN